MKQEQIEKIIESIKSDAELLSLFWENVSYHSFYSDLDWLGLLVFPFWNADDECKINEELVQIQIIDKKGWSTNLQMKWYMDKVESFLNSKMKNLSWFETFRINFTWDEVLLKNNKERWIMTKRFLFYY